MEKMKTKFKKGDVCRIKISRNGKTSGHSFKRGDIVRISKVYTEPNVHYKAYKGRIFWWVDDADLVKVKPDLL